MKVIIAGSRGLYDRAEVEKAILRSGFMITEVVSGEASGVDRIGEAWAEDRGVRVCRFPANWDKHGKAAGPIRNGEMADYADALIAVMWEAGTPGTENMVGQMRSRRKPTYIHRVKKPADVPQPPRRP